MEAAAAAAQEQDGRVLNAFYLNMICIELNSAAKKTEKKNLKTRFGTKKVFFLVVDKMPRPMSSHFSLQVIFFQFCDLLVLNTFV